MNLRQLIWIHQGSGLNWSVIDHWQGELPRYTTAERALTLFIDLQNKMRQPIIYIALLSIIIWLSLEAGRIFLFGFALSVALAELWFLLALARKSRRLFNPLSRLAADYGKLMQYKFFARLASNTHRNVVRSFGIDLLFDYKRTDTVRYRELNEILEKFDLILLGTRARSRPTVDQF